MKRGTFFRVSRWLAVSIVLCLSGLTIFNVVDYRRFRFAMGTGTRLGPAGLQQLASACAAAEEFGHQRYENNDWPAAFDHLRPRRVSFYPGSSDITLYRSDDSDYGMYVFLRIATTPHNQTITCVSHLNGPDQAQLLWVRDPEFERSLNPMGRLATVVANDGLSDWTTWIVLENEILVIESSGRVGSEDRIVARAPLSERQQAEIKTALAAIGAGIRGHAFEAPISDGYGLDITFTPDGSRGDGIRLHNTWRPEVKPLLDCISTVLPAAHQIQFESRMLRREPVPEEYIRKRTWAEVDRSEAPELPWWCLWPRLIRAAPSSG